MAEVSIRNTTSSPPPRVPFKTIATNLLGKDGEVSLVFVSKQEALRLNKKHRKKTYVPNVLTFPLEKKRGEIFMCLPVAKTDAPEFGLSYAAMVTLLFIHALLHLKGVPHGSTMDRTERRLLKRFSA